MRVREKAPRTLILTHLRNSAENYKAVQRHGRGLWNLCSPLNGRPFFDHRLYVQENMTQDLLGQVEMRPGQDLKWFSTSGALDDSTLPPIYHSSLHDHVSIAQLGFVRPGMKVFVLGGGNGNHCLFNTFQSLVEIKDEHQEALYALIPLPAVYFSSRVYDPVGYIRNPNEYSAYLAGMFHGRHVNIGGYRITVDGRLLPDGSDGAPAVNLHWFTSFQNMFASPFFPGLRGRAIKV